MDESVSRIEPALLGERLPASVADLVAEVARESAILGSALHPTTARNLAALVRIMNTYYSSLIEGHNTRPRDIERALAGDFYDDQARRDLQFEAAAHVRVQQAVEEKAMAGTLAEPASVAFILWLHREFYAGAPAAMLHVEADGREWVMVPGEWRSGAEQDVTVGRHHPPSSDRVDEFMRYFESRYRLAPLGVAAKVTAIACAHHRFNYIHPFLDGNGRVSRLMSDAMTRHAGIGAHGLWSVSRGLARGLESRREYKSMMDRADTPRESDLDGRGNLSERALIEFVEWFLSVCLDQIRFMSGLFEINTLAERLRGYVNAHGLLKPEAARLLEEALIRGEFDRGEAPRITGLPERTARRVLNAVVDDGLLGSSTPKGAVSLRFPARSLEALFPALYPET